MVSSKGVTSNDEKSRDFKKVGRTSSKPLKEREFKVQNSLLTDLWETNGGKVIYNILIAHFIGLLVHSLVKDIMEGGGIKSGFRIVYYNFGKPHLVLLSLMGYNSLTVCAYLCFSLWIQIRFSLLPKSLSIKFWDYLWSFTFIAYSVFSFYSANLLVASFRLPPASAVIVVEEQVRLSMKTYAFIRHCVPKVLKCKPYSGDTLKFPTFSKFAYFLYAPTLVYKDEYPRTKTIRWDFVLRRMLEVVAVIFYISFLCEKILPIYKDFGLRKFTWGEIISSFFDLAGFGMLELVLTFYHILHSSQNMAAELLRFGDRMFYLDWWNCTSLPEYFQKWNVLVNDWLYINIYRDAFEMSGSKTVAKLIVYILSGLVHEWMIFSTLGYFMPFCLLLYVMAALVSFVTPLKSSVTNVLFWYLAPLFSGNLFAWYALENYARINVPVNDSTWRNYFLPWWSTCDCIE